MDNKYTRVLIKIPIKLWSKTKANAALQQKTVQQVVEELLEKYTEVRK